MTDIKKILSERKQETFRDKYELNSFSKKKGSKSQLPMQKVIRWPRSWVRKWGKNSKQPKKVCLVISLDRLTKYSEISRVEKFLAFYRFVAAILRWKWRLPATGVHPVPLVTSWHILQSRGKFRSEHHWWHQRERDARPRGAGC